jgi:serine/threonine protein kinase
MFPGLSEEAIMRRIYDSEFSASKLLELTDLRYIARVSPPIKGFDEYSKKAMFLPTTKYEITLEDRLAQGKLTRQEALRYLSQIALALNNCHAEGIVHKDLKPANIGINKKDEIVLSDFGCSSVFSSDENTRYQYPLMLRPPELAYDDNYWKDKQVWQTSLFTPSANIWTLGVLAYRMITGKYLFGLKEKRAPPGTKKYHEQNKQVYEQIHSFKGFSSMKEFGRLCDEVGYVLASMFRDMLCKDSNGRSIETDGFDKIVVRENEKLGDYLAGRKSIDPRPLPKKKK